MIVSFCTSENGIVCSDILSNCFGFIKIKRCTVYGNKSTGRNELVVYLGNIVGLQPQLMGKDLFAGITRQVEVAVVGKIDRRFGISFLPGSR